MEAARKAQDRMRDEIGGTGGKDIDQTTGTISGRSFSKSLFSEVTPFILALS